jgi:hypothetical protein
MNDLTTQISFHHLTGSCSRHKALDHFLPCIAYSASIQFLLAAIRLFLVSMSVVQEWIVKQYILKLVNVTGTKDIEAAWEICPA